LGEVGWKVPYLLATEEETHMRYAITAVIGLVSIGATPASAAPQWVEDKCFLQALRVLPALRADEKEAYIANCIADYTANPQGKRRKFKRSY
jgi:hypothetical protein